MLDDFDKKKNPFKVPENYFQDFNKMIMDQLPEKEVSKVRIVPLWKKVLPWTAVAAALFGILFSVGVFDKITMSNDKVLAEQKNEVKESSIVYGDINEEEDYYLFLQDEVRKSHLKEMLDNY